MSLLDLDKQWRAHIPLNEIPLKMKYDNVKQE